MYNTAMGWAMSSPTLFMGSDTIYNIYKTEQWDRVSHWASFVLAHPTPPHHLANTIGGSRLNCPWPTGT